MRISLSDLESAFQSACLAMRRKDRPVASMHNAGMVTLRDVGPCEVFVKVCRFDPELLKAEPETGGLLCERT